MTESDQNWKLLLVDDDVSFRGGLANFLKQSGHIVVESGSGSSALQQAVSEPFDAIVLDLMLPEISGLQFLGLLRKTKSTPVIMISSVPELDYRLTAFQEGADDFLVKPVSHQEVRERLRAILRRTLPAKSSIIRIRNVEIDLNANIVTLDGAMVHLSPSEFDLLALLAKNRGRIMGRSVLQEKIFGKERPEYSNMIDQYIMKLRRKLGKELISTKIGMGFVIYV